MQREIWVLDDTDLERTITRLVDEQANPSARDIEAVDEEVTDILEDRPASLSIDASTMLKNVCVRFLGVHGSLFTKTG